MSTLLAAYNYNALNRRIIEDDGTTETHLFYSADWQVLEEQGSGQTTTQYVWSPVYIDALILRDRDTDSDGNLDERLYVQQDANWNVTALVDALTGDVVQRFVQDPFGLVTDILGNNWSAQADAFDWKYLHQGLRFDAQVDKYDNRMRIYDPVLQRFIQVDPIGFEAGDGNFYRYVGNGPGNATDPWGLLDWNLNERAGSIEMVVKIKLNFEGNWTPARETTFKTEFVRTIENAYNGSQYRLYPSVSEYLILGRRQGPGCMPGRYSFTDSRVIPNSGKGWWPRLQVQLVSKSYDFKIQVHAAPAPKGWRSYAYRGGRWIGTDAFLYENDVKPQPNFTGNSQITVVHEFGHLLGLRHPGQDLKPPAVANSNPDYLADAQALMGGGMEFRPAYFKKWADKLAQVYGDVPFEVRPLPVVRALPVPSKQDWTGRLVEEAESRWNQRQY